MDNKIVAGILVIGVIILVGFLSLNSSGAVVSAVGQSNLEFEPDEVSVWLNIQERNDTAQLAKAQHDKIVDDVVIELLRAGLERKDIQMVNYNIYQEYDWEDGQRKEKGFVARQTIIVETDDFDLVPGIVDGAVDGGALVGSINFELSEEKQSDYKVQALEEAGEDARKKAEATAAGLGKKLGSLVSVRSQDFNYRPYMYYEAAASGGDMAAAEAKVAATDLAPRNIDVTASIAVEYRLRSF